VSTWQRVKRRRFVYLALLPTFLLLGIFSYYPAVSAIYHSFYEWDGVVTERFIGLDNFRQMAHDELLIGLTPKPEGDSWWAKVAAWAKGRSKSAIAHMIVLVAAGVLITATVPLFAAEMIFHLRSERWRYWYRVLFVIPMVVPGMVTLLIWQFIYDGDIGLLNSILRGVGLGSLTHAWLGESSTALYSIIGIGFPWVAGLSFLIYLAGLENIPESLLDAAAIDGAGPLTRFRRVDLPLIMGQVKLLVILAIIGGVQGFQSILVLTMGGPGTATLVPGLHMYLSAFSNDRMGYACAIGLAMFVLILITTIINMKYLRSSVEYEGA
jgi:raffinose/stachyose/melibiose transport system permease protein